MLSSQKPGAVYFEIATDSVGLIMFLISPAWQQTQKASFFFFSRFIKTSCFLRLLANIWERRSTKQLADVDQPVVWRGCHDDRPRMQSVTTAQIEKSECDLSTGSEGPRNDPRETCSLSTNGSLVCENSPNNNATQKIFPECFFLIQHRAGGQRSCRPKTDPNCLQPG